MTTTIILQNSIGTQGFSAEFRINLVNPIANGEKAQLGIYGTLGTSTLFTLLWKAPDGTFYDTGDVIDGIGLFEIPYINDIIFKVMHDSVIIPDAPNINIVGYNITLV